MTIDTQRLYYPADDEQRAHPEQRVFVRFDVPAPRTHADWLPGRVAIFGKRLALWWPEGAPIPLPQQITTPHAAYDPHFGKNAEMIVWPEDLEGERTTYAVLDSNEEVTVSWRPAPAVPVPGQNGVLVSKFAGQPVLRHNGDGTMVLLNYFTGATVKTITGGKAPRLRVTLPRRDVVREAREQVVTGWRFGSGSGTNGDVEVDWPRL
ncbi:hypothetical protein ACFC5T_17080 [Streptomyces sp. NPDC055961]|uniref:hypothetical protein n=1 Tax=Streptomyces sp. NPDC055961 TaxID=3345666 RepID=UPI0035DA3743